MLNKSVRRFLYLMGLFILLAEGMFGYSWLLYYIHKKSITQKMDQYYLSLTSLGREEYLLEDDETFEVPYMASQLSVAAVPTRIYDIDDRLIAEFSVDKGVFVSSPDQLPPFLKKALIASEDGTFYEHHGINWKALIRALIADIRHMAWVQGGSTLTQQLAKQMFTTRKKILGRKVFEIFCAKKLEQKFTKDQILLMYLNFANFGPGVFGVEAAARHYFNKSARELELAEAAMLVGLIPNPTRYSPYQNLELSQARHRTVLKRMAKLGFIPESAVLRYSEDFWQRHKDWRQVSDVSFWKTKVNEAPYVIEYLRREMIKTFSKERLLKGGLKIRTTFDLELQEAAQQAIKDGLRRENWISEVSRSVSPMEGSLAALRPSDGAILALVGGSGFNFRNQLIRASDSYRPMGSAVKPFIYAVAFESGRFKPEDILKDGPIEFKIGAGKRWSPRNYGGKYHGPVTLSFALHKSLNSVAIQVLKSVDIDDVIKALSAATGAAPKTFPRDLSLALGTADLSALQMARAYGVFLNGGKSVEPYFIRKIEDRNGNAITEGINRPAPVEVLRPETCALMIGVMKGVLGLEGSARPAVLRTGFNIPAAGKTGTTNDYRDAWFAGFTPDFSAAVWLGHDDMRRSLGEGKAGGSLAAPIWMNFVKAAYRNRPTKDFDTPVPNR
ncbi:MAG: hypothetical protein A3J74_11310 [Elusimicrobia bacterium RIFCSPHIGHO2_02_FULL_57_9]|nr:MAG: hypothetical protein A3J74_11310 [Elusimicrobia bacterium RIFCSPHIGHO2_02_FULL_57_9]